MPDVSDRSGPSFHLSLFNVKVMQQQEVLLALMDVNLNEFTEPENKEELPKLRSAWLESAADILTGASTQSPPFREVNHKMTWKDENEEYKYHLPRCPDSLKVPLLEKTERYLKAGWWEPVNVPAAAPMMCIPKKGTTKLKLRTVIDCQKRNENTVKDVTPFPDQEQIRNDVARKRYHSKIDMSDVYEQIHINPKDVWKTAFATVYSTYVSHTMQQGDCNVPAAFQRLMTTVFRDFIGRFVHVYLDYIFIFSDLVEEHEGHLRMVFDTLRQAQLFLEPAKLDLYSKKWIA